MSKKSETIFKERVLADLKGLPNCYARKISQVSIRGMPDIIGCISGLFFSLELKATERDRPDERQKYELNKIKEAGGIALAVHPGTWPLALEALRGIPKKVNDIKGL